MREKRKNTLFLKKSPGKNGKYTPFFFRILGPDFVARKVPDILVTRMVSLRSRSGWWGGGESCPSSENIDAFQATGYISDTFLLTQATSGEQLCYIEWNI